MMKAKQWLKTLLSQAGGWLIPHFCVLCGTPVEGLPGSDLPLCDRCLSGLPEIRGVRCSTCGKELFSEKDTCYACREACHVCSEVYPIFRYRAEPAALLRRYKSGKRASLAKFWAERMALVIEQRWPDHVIVPVPPRLEKLKRREWDQVEAIAGCLEKMGYVVERVLFRNATAQQKHLSRIARKTNAEKGYFIIPKFSARAPARVILIDDVYTTGATVDSCARALCENGSEKVVALVIAAD